MTERGTVGSERETIRSPPARARGGSDAERGAEHVDKDAARLSARDRNASPRTGGQIRRAGHGCKSATLGI
eukprot:5386744-Prymnesium_polylepis.2